MTGSVRNVERRRTDGLETLRLSNGLVSVDVIPGLGGRIWELRDLVRDRQWVWHAAGARLRAPLAGTAYDDAWVGGWEELFPNDAEETFDGVALPDHGEWWSRAWDWEQVDNGPDRCAIRLTLQTRVIRARCTKTVEVVSGERAVRVRYQIVNEEPRRIRFLLKQHLAVALSPDCRIELPGGMVTPVEPGFGTRIGAPGPFSWPMAIDRHGAPVDVATVTETAEKHREFVYVSDCPDGWCGIRDLRSGASIRMEFSREVFPFTWLFMTYGGWRDHFTTVLEPCTNVPKHLSAAAAANRCARLQPGETLATDVCVSLS